MTKPVQYFDLETRSTWDVKKVGAAKLAEDPTLRILSCHFAIDDRPIAHWRGVFGGPDQRPECFDDPETDEYFAEFMDNIENDCTVWAHNCMFDFQIWNACAERYGFPGLQLEQMRDSAAICRALNLPGALGQVAKMLGLQKLDNSTYHPLWKIAKNAGPVPAENLRALFEHMLTYGDGDVDVMRDIINTLPNGVDWEEYIAAERVNLRGVSVDLDWCQRAVAQKDEVMEQVKEELDYMTYGAVQTPKQTAAAREWVEGELLREGLLEPGEHLTKQFKKRRKNDVTFYTETRPCFDKSVRRELKEQLLECEDPEALAHVLDVLDLLEEGAASSVSKYEAALRRANADGRLRGMYIFGGAQQTGRFTSNGMQTHNLLRAKVKGSIAEAMDKARTLAEVAQLLRATLKAEG